MELILYPSLWELFYSLGLDFSQNPLWPLDSWSSGANRLSRVLSPVFLFGTYELNSSTDQWATLLQREGTRALSCNAVVATAGPLLFLLDSLT